MTTSLKNQHTAPVLETPRLKLSILHKQDLPAFAALNSDPEVMKYFPSLINKTQSLDFIKNEQKTYTHTGYCLFACILKENHEFMGFVGLHKVGFAAAFSPAIEVGWRLAKKYWNNGYATEAALAVIDFGFTKIGLDEIVSFTACQNKASIRVMEKCGLTRDPADDFLHPNLKNNHPLAPHVLYRIKKCG